MSLLVTEVEAQDWLRGALGVDAPGMARLSQLVDLLLEENERQNLVARGTLPHVWVRHIVDSAQLLHVSRETLPAGTWLDLGTGAGFPGLAVAALQPDRAVTLVDSRRLRTEWLQRAADALGLANVRVVLSRVEDFPSGPHAVISARAFAPLDKLVTLSARFSTPDTLWLLPKGARAAQELQMLPESWNHLFHVEQSLTDANAGIITGRLLGEKERPAHVFRQRGKK
jgi:16S rRNA (guanine527-N7)-methyltransferase